MLFDQPLASVINRTPSTCFCRQEPKGEHIAQQCKDIGLEGKYLPGSRNYQRPTPCMWP